TNLPAATTESAATVADVWDQTGQTLTNRYWLSNVAGFSGWRHADFSDANNLPIDANKGLIVTLRSGTGLLSVAGFVPIAAQMQTVQNNGYSLVASRFPMPVALTNSGLAASGFVGGTSLV